MWLVVKHNKRSLVLKLETFIFLSFVLFTTLAVLITLSTANSKAGSQTIIINKTNYAELNVGSSDVLEYESALSLNTSETAHNIRVSVAIDSPSVQLKEDMPTIAMIFSPSGGIRWQGECSPKTTIDYVSLLGSEATVTSFSLKDAIAEPGDKLLLKTNIEAIASGTANICMYLPATEDHHTGIIEEIDIIDDKHNLIVKETVVDIISSNDTDTASDVMKTIYYPLSGSIDVRDDAYPAGHSFDIGSWDPKNIDDNAFSKTRIVVKDGSSQSLDISLNESTETALSEITTAETTDTASIPPLHSLSGPIISIMEATSTIESTVSISPVDSENPVSVDSSGSVLKVVETPSDSELTEFALRNSTDTVVSIIEPDSTISNDAEEIAVDTQAVIIDQNELSNEMEPIEVPQNWFVVSIDTQTVEFINMNGSDKLFPGEVAIASITIKIVADIDIKCTFDCNGFTLANPETDTIVETKPSADRMIFSVDGQAYQIGDFIPLASDSETNVESATKEIMIRLPLDYSYAPGFYEGSITVNIFSQ